MRRIFLCLVFLPLFASAQDVVRAKCKHLKTRKESDNVFITAMRGMDYESHVAGFYLRVEGVDSSYVFWSKFRGETSDESRGMRATLQNEIELDFPEASHSVKAVSAGSAMTRPWGHIGKSIVSRQELALFVDHPIQSIRLGDLEYNLYGKKKKSVIMTSAYCLLR